MTCSTFFVLHKEFLTFFTKLDILHCDHQTTPWNPTLWRLHSHSPTQTSYDPFQYIPRNPLLEILRPKCCSYLLLLQRLQSGHCCLSKLRVFFVYLQIIALAGVATGFGYQPTGYGYGLYGISCPCNWY